MGTPEVLTIFAVVATNLGTVIALYIQTDSKLTAIATEMKDFHGRLEKIDADFKGKLAIQDAEFKGKLALQDAEFKNHLMSHCK